MRDQIKTVLFHNSFHLKGLDGEQPAGTYDVVTTEELIPSLWFEAWRRTETQIRIPSRERNFGQTQSVTIQPQELEDALLSDRGGEPSRTLNFIRD